MSVLLNLKSILKHFLRINYVGCFSFNSVSNSGFFCVCEIKQKCLKTRKSNWPLSFPYTMSKINNVVKVLLCMQTLYFQSLAWRKGIQRWGENETCLEDCNVTIHPNKNIFRPFRFWNVFRFTLAKVKPNYLRDIHIVTCPQLLTNGDILLTQFIWQHIILFCKQTCQCHQIFQHKTSRWH